MAQKLFKGFMQVTEGSFAPENGYIYFVRNSANTGHTDGYLQFNGKKYGTAEEAKNDLESLIGALPEGYTNVVDYVNAMVGEGVDELNATVTGESNGVRVEIVEEAGKLTGVTVAAPDFDNTYAPKAAFEAVSGQSHTHANKALLDSYTQTEANLADAVNKKHTHANQATLDGITAAYTTEEKAKLADIAEGAEVNVQADWNEADSTSDAFILNKPENLVQDANYVHTDNNYTAQEKTKLEEVEAGAQVNVIETVKVNGTALTVSDKAVDVVIPAAAEYTIVKRDEAEQGYLATYALTKDGTQVGANINIPKDFLVRSAEVKTVTTADDPYQGASVGDKYIDFVINTSGATTGGDHIYLPVNELVDVYTDGDGIDVSADNIISVQIDSANANGLSVGSNGVALALATDASAGAMSIADHAKLTRLDASAATKTEVGVLSSRVDTLEAISLQSISAADNSVAVGQKDSDKNQTVGVKISQAANNGLSLNNDGLFAAIYYDGDDSE